MKEILVLLIVNFILNLLVQQKLLPSQFTYINLILTSVLSVYTATKKININLKNVNTTISEGTAYMYPLIMSFVIFIIYMIIKNFKTNKELILGIIFYTSIISNLTNLINIDNKIIIGIIVSWFIFTYLNKNKYSHLKLYINNIIAILVALSSIGTINVSNMKTIIILLIGLFLFDIFWVFGSKKVIGEGVMESVATNIDAPIMLKFFNNNKVRDTMILGLGDIVIPALFIKSLVGTPHYNKSIISYVVGLIFTVLSAVVFKNGQPALLYIVPSLLIPYFLIPSNN